MNFSFFLDELQKLDKEDFIIFLNYPRTRKDIMATDTLQKGALSEEDFHRRILQAAGDTTAAQYRVLPPANHYHGAENTSDSEESDVDIDVTGTKMCLKIFYWRKVQKSKVRSLHASNQVCSREINPGFEKKKPIGTVVQNRGLHWTHQINVILQKI